MYFHNSITARWITLPIMVVIAIFGGIKAASAQALGSAGYYNVYVLTNDTATGDSEGAVAVGGNATFTQYSVASNLSNGSAANLVVGGTLNAVGSTVNGSVYANNVNYADPSINGNVYGNNVNLNSYGTVNGNVTSQSSNTSTNVSVSGKVGTGIYTSPINFGSTDQTLFNDSANWSNLAATGTTTSSYGTTTLTATGPSKTYYVFDITGTELSQENNLIINAPAGSTVLVNISGTSDTWSGGLTLNGPANDDVIYNFYQATNLSLSGIGIDGSVLAANAAVNFSGGEVHGNLIAGSLNDFNGGEAHNGDDPGNTDLFAGLLPGGQISVVPEPSTTFTILLGLSLMTGLLLRRGKKYVTLF